MKYSDFENKYFNPIKANINNLDFQIVYSNLVKTFIEKYKLFKNDYYSKVWYEALLKQFKEITSNTKLASDERLNSILDLSIILEIKSMEVKIDINKLYVADLLNKYGIV